MPAVDGAGGVRRPALLQNVARQVGTRHLGESATRTGRGADRTFLADAVCWGWLASARMAKPPAEEGPETKFLIRCMAFTWLPLTGARTRREGVVESFSMSDACCLATGSAAACGCCLFDEPMRKTLLSIVAREKRPGRGAARAGWPLSEAVGGDSVSAGGPALGASACAARCCLLVEEINAVAW
jgi:hypothetical protein